MADRFNDFRLAINDPDYFFGRTELLDNIRRSPFDVRIILGGRRLGKTSLLNAIRWTFLLAAETDSNRALPVFFDFQRERPKSLENFRYLLIKRLQKTLENPQTLTPTEGFNWQQNYDRFLRQITEGSVNALGVTLKVSNPDREQTLSNEDFTQDLITTFRQLHTINCQGVCFLFDGAEYIVKQPWANDAWSYLRSLKDTPNTAIQPFLGLIFSGYRDLKDYQQRTGSPLLNIARVDWLSTLSETATKALIQQRCDEAQITLTTEQIDTILAGAGYHPYLTHQMLNLIFDNMTKADPLPGKALGRRLIKELRQRDFAPWWDEDQKTYGFGSEEQKIYRALMVQHQSTAEAIADQLEDMSLGQIEDALDVLAGTGVIRQLEDKETYIIGSKLFAQWVREK